MKSYIGLLKYSLVILLPVILTLSSCSVESTIIEGEECGSTITYEGKIYTTVLIGDQCWLQENLDVGTMIISNDNSDNQTDNGVIEKYCYDNDPSNCETYGGLYQWDEAMLYSSQEGNQGICPPGWHIPTYAELQTLVATVGGSSNALKAEGQGSDNGTGTNTSGFSALFAGFRYGHDANFSSIGKGTPFWSSTEYDSTTAKRMYLRYDNDNVAFPEFYYLKTHAYCIRCIRDN